MAFTKRGDAGQTDLYNQTRHSKSALYFDCVGALDELSAHLGIVKSYLSDTTKISIIQLTLLQLGSHLATPPIKRMTRHQEQRVRDTVFDPEGELIRRIEAWTQEDYKRLPPLKTFLLPGPNGLAASLHVARTICRRAERRIVALAAQNPNTVNPQALQYINRLSSLLFVWARVAQELPKNEFETENKCLLCLQRVNILLAGFVLILALALRYFKF